MDICPWTLSVPLRERSSWKTVGFEKKIMSKDKYPSIFSRQMEVIVLIIIQIVFRNTRDFENWRIPSFSGGISHATRLDHSRASENI